MKLVVVVLLGFGPQPDASVTDGADIVATEVPPGRLEIVKSRLPVPTVGTVMDMDSLLNVVHITKRCMEVIQSTKLEGKL